MKQLQKVSFVCHVLNILHIDSSSHSKLKPNESLSVFGKLKIKQHIKYKCIIMLGGLESVSGKVHAK